MLIFLTYLPYLGSHHEQVNYDVLLYLYLSISIPVNLFGYKITISMGIYRRSPRTTPSQSESCNNTAQTDTQMERKTTIAASIPDS